LCAEGYAQLLETFVQLAGIVDPAERLKALGRAYVAFGVAHPETYRLIFMEDPSYTGAALGGAAGAPGAAKARARADAEAGITSAHTSAPGMAATPVGEAGSAALSADDDPGAAALHIMLAALEELRAAGRLSASMDTGVWAEAFWATLHGIVALNLTCPVFPTAPLDTVVEIALDAWLGTPQAAPQTARRAAQPRRAANSAGARKKKSADSQAALPVEPDSEPAALPSSSQSTKAPANKAIGPGTKRKTASP
jgi:hypothetical protein